MELLVGSESRRPTSPYSVEQRLAVMEGELAALRRTTGEHTARFRLMDSVDSPGSGYRSVVESSQSRSRWRIQRMNIDELARAAFDTRVSFPSPALASLANVGSVCSFWTSMAPCAPYIDPMTDTYLAARSNPFATPPVLRSRGRAEVSLERPFRSVCRSGRYVLCKVELECALVVSLQLSNECGPPSVYSETSYSR
jgi:hypothetical protein